MYIASNSSNEWHADVVKEEYTSRTPFRTLLYQVWSMTLLGVGAAAHFSEESANSSFWVNRTVRPSLDAAGRPWRGCVIVDPQCVIRFSMFNITTLRLLY